MRPFLILMVSGLVLTGGCQPQAQPREEGAAEEQGGSVAVADPDALTPDGWGAIRIGMTREQLERAAGPDANPGAVGGPEPEVCDEYRPERAPEGLRVMVEDGVVTRISVSEPSTLTTPDGFGVGSDAAGVRAAHGADADVTPHRYVDGGEYITVWREGAQGDARATDPQARGVVYETDGRGVVRSIHVGGPSIQYVEGCA